MTASNKAVEVRLNPSTAKLAETPNGGVPRNDSMSSEEPFDQKKSTKTMRTIDEQFEELDDGELPSLQRKPTVGGRIIAGQRTTARPLSPPSSAGLVTPPAGYEQQRKFWSQLDVGKTDVDEERDYLDDIGPDDELAARRSHEPQSSYGEEIEAVESEEALATDFCASTLQAIGDMCGNLNAYRDSPKQTKYDRKQPRHDPPIQDEQEEHTAIEVEFVEPNKKEVSPTRKSKYLTAMARKAKEDFEKNKKIKENPNSEIQDNDSLADDFYNSFSATEKRKFLKLINTGIPPSEATQQILGDRKHKEEEHEPDQVSEDVEVKLQRSKESAVPRKSRAAMLAFWKKSNKKPETSSPAENEGIITPEQNEKNIVNDVNENAIKANGNDANSNKLGNNVSRAFSPSQLNATQPLSEDDESPSTFAKSGVNYYDAVRRESSEDDSDVDGVNVRSLGTTSKTRAGVLRPTTPKRTGFKYLGEKRAKSAPRGRTPVESMGTSPSRPLQSSVAGNLVPEDTTVVTPEHLNRIGDVTPRTVKSLLAPKATDSVSRIERELLRPASTMRSESPPPAPPNRDFPSSKKAVQAPLMTPPSRRAQSVPRMRIKQRPDNIIASKGMEVDMDTYLSSIHSNEEFSLNPSLQCGDTVSVYTAGSVLTGASSYTQSSRVRRPGVAKSRLAQEKAARKNKKNGWHDSIKAAAASTNRVWKPEIGWVDYHDPGSVAVDDKSNDKIRIDLNKSTKNRTGRDGERNIAPDGSPVRVPFPANWQKERSEMLQSETPLSSGQDTATVQTGEMPAMNTGWVESMKVASARLAKDGLTWSPETGWTNSLDESKPLPLSIKEDVSVVDSPNVIRNSTDDAGNSEPNQSLEEPTAIPSHQGIDQKLNHWMEKAEKTTKNPSEMSTESSNKAVASTETPVESYVQLADNGSVRLPTQVHKMGTSPLATAKQFAVDRTAESYISDESEEGDEAPLLQNSGAFPSAAKMALSPSVDVVREKVGEDDLALFPTAKKVPASDLQEENPLPQSSSVSNQSQGSSRRGAGPVDIDKIEEESDSDDEKQETNGWDAESYPMADASRSFDSGSVSTKSLPTKRVPKLNRSKRDTSPIRGKADQSVEAAWKREEAVIAHEVARQSTEVFPREIPYNKAAKTAVVTPEPTRRPSSVASPSVKQRLRQWESRDLETNPSSENDSKRTPSRVKKRLQQWESRAVGVEPESDTSSQGPTTNAEWKAFMAKKVKAESEAAVPRQTGKEDIKQSGSSDGRALVSRDALKGTDFEDDSIFEFNERDNAQKSSKSDQSASALEVSELSPISLKDENESVLYGSEAYGPDEKERKSFFQRLTECAAPVMNSSSSMPSAHLAFLRSNPVGGVNQQSSRYLPTNLCGKPDIIEEDNKQSDDDSRGTDKPEVEHARQKAAIKKEKVSTSSYSRDPSHGVGEQIRSSGSVVSSDFGEKTAYLEAIAMKAAVSKPRRSQSAKRARSSAPSVASGASSQYSQSSERWRAYLERKRASSGNARDDQSEVSRAAERYTAGKMEEIRSKSAPRSYRLSEGPNDAAEDLAAARVEAMMAALSSPQNMEEGEI